MNGFQIRPAEASDAAVLAALSIQVWLDTYAEGVNSQFADYVLHAFTPEKIQGELAQNNCLVSTLDGAVVAFAVFGLANSATEHGVEVSRLYVQPRFQQQGVGHALFAELCRQLGQFWLSVYHANHNAIRFYHRQGMRQVGRSYFELGCEQHENYVLAFGGATT
ncbi:GNAT family N-acetyltransferase [Chitinibacter tainanensis]|uniref:GNAT family N-acetyltransferase n=1 Tax=Chitinibacter tainanensis TaxID=230667 RepID=UPI00040C7AB3|nr:GNAT family N-acetyltransferase [Chitinibacter tainanensis]